MCLVITLNICYRPRVCVCAVRLLPRERWRPAKLDAELEGISDDDVIPDDADLAGLDDQNGGGPSVRASFPLP